MKKGSYAQYCYWKTNQEQECIPVGCVPSAAVAISPGGVCLSACWDTTTTPPGADPPGPGTPGSRPPQEQTAPGTRHLPGPGTPPGGQTHACENITFATSLRTVKRWLLKVATVFPTPSRCNEVCWNSKLEELIVGLPQYIRNSTTSKSAPFCQWFLQSAIITVNHSPIIGGSLRVS